MKQQTKDEVRKGIEGKYITRLASAPDTTNHCKVLSMIATIDEDGWAVKFSVSSVIGGLKEFSSLAEAVRYYASL